MMKLTEKFGNLLPEGTMIKSPLHALHPWLPVISPRRLLRNSFNWKGRRAQESEQPSQTQNQHPTIQPVSTVAREIVIKTPKLMGLEEYKSIPCTESPYVYIMVDSYDKLLAASSHLRKQTLLSVDCEGVNLSRNGKLCLVQIATEKDTFLFDVLALGDTTFVAGIGSILQDEDILKVMHDCRADSDALFHQHQIALNNVFDTQIAHALHEKITQGWSAKKRSSLVDVVRVHSPESMVELKYKMEIKPLYSRNSALWEQRPLTQLLINYACADVRVLFPIYKVLSNILKSSKEQNYLSKNFKQQLHAFRDSTSWPPPPHDLL